MNNPFRKARLGIASAMEPRSNPYGAPDAGYAPQDYSALAGADESTQAAAPIAAFIEALATSGKGTGVSSYLQGQDKAKDYRLKSMERELGMGKAQREGDFQSELQALYSKPTKDTDARDKQAIELYKKYHGEDATTRMLEKSLTTSHPRITDFNKKYDATKAAHPDWSEERILDYVMQPSSQIGPSGERLEGARKLAEQGALGANAPSVGEAAGAKESRIEDITRPGKAKTAAAEAEAKLPAAAAAAQIDVETAGKKEQQTFDITKKQSKKSLDFVLQLGEKLPAQGRSLSGVVTEAGAAVGTKANVRNYNQFFNTAVSNLARSYGGEKGVLTDYDIERMKGFKYSVFDTPDERAGKKAFMQTLTNPNVTPEDIPAIIESTYGKINAEADYSSEAEARKAGHKTGDRVRIGGVSGTLTD